VFLSERGLSLSEEKTHITRSEQGFDFLGQHLRKYGDKLLIRPSKTAVAAICAKTKEIIINHRGRQTAGMIGKLNSVLRGWANYHRFVCSSAAFARVDSHIFWHLWRWARRRHKTKGKRWTRRHYFRVTDSTQWQFFDTVPGKEGQRKIVDLFRAGSMKITRHVKIRGAANPYDPEMKGYFQSRRTRGWARLPPDLAGCTI